MDGQDNDESLSSSSSSSLGLTEVACTAVDDVILLDLTTTWEVRVTFVQQCNTLY